MGIINVNGIKIYAFHGCLEEEAIIGGQYVVDVKIETDFSEAEISDDLTKTVYYVTVYNIVKAQMSIRSTLNEHAAGNIARALIKQIPAIQHVEVKVTKINPPMNGEVKEVSVMVMAGT